MAELTPQELEQRDLERMAQRDLAIQTRKRPLHYDRWWLWPDDDAHRIRMENDMFRHFNHNPLGRSLYNDPTLRSIPRFVATHMDGSQRGFNNGHMTRTHLYPFFNLEEGHNYRIYMKNSPPYEIPGGRPYIHAIYLHYVYRNGIPHAKMFVVETNLPINVVRVNQLHLFDIRDFSNWLNPEDISTRTPAILAQFKQMRMDSSGTRNQAVMSALTRQKTQDGTYFPLPTYQRRLGNFGGKSKTSKNRKSKTSKNRKR